MILCWSCKGGSGTTVVACALAMVGSEPTTLVDLGGDCPAVLGIPEPATPGVTDWLASPVAGPPALHRLTVAVSSSLRLVPRGTISADHHRWHDLLGALRGRVVIDAGGVPPPELHEAASQSLLVIRPCYLAVQHAARSPLTPTGVVLLREPGRVLRSADIEHSIGAPVVAELSLDPAVARAVDAGLLVTRLPKSLTVALRRAA